MKNKTERHKIGLYLAMSNETKCCSGLAINCIYGFRYILLPDYRMNMNDKNRFKCVFKQADHLTVLFESILDLKEFVIISDSCTLHIAYDAIIHCGFDMQQNYQNVRTSWANFVGAVKPDLPFT